MPARPNLPPRNRPNPPVVAPNPQVARSMPFRTAWPGVLCVIGLDYLSTLAYHPSIAFGAAGRLAPLVTVLVARVTLFSRAAGVLVHRGPVAARRRLDRPVGTRRPRLVRQAAPARAARVRRGGPRVHPHFSPPPRPRTPDLQPAPAVAADARRGHPPGRGFRRGTAARGSKQPHRRVVEPPDGRDAHRARAQYASSGLVFFKGYTRNFVRLAVFVVPCYLR